MRKFFLSNLLFVGIVVAQEPSAFNAGGLAPKKSEYELFNEKLFNLSNRLKALEESQEGLKSVFGSYTQKIQNNSHQISAINQKKEVEAKNSLDIASMKAQVDENFKVQNENIDKIKESIATLSALIEKTNKQTKEEIDGLRDEIEALQGVFGSEKSTLNKEKENQDKSGDVSAVKSDEKLLKETSSDSLSKEEKDRKIVKTDKESKEKKDKEKVSKTPADAFRIGEDSFVNKEYEVAKENLEFAIRNAYKPAKSNYLLGEIAFVEKRYEDAIYYYRTSATRYDKADYMPRLMLNSAKSFKATKDEESAKKFLDTLVALYPKSQEAIEAKKILTNK